MSKEIEDTLNRIKMILGPDVLNNIHTANGKNNTEILVFDVHGYSVKKAKREINNIIALNRSGCQLRIVHGYNHGTAIKDMLNSEEFNNKKVLRKVGHINNAGITDLQIEKM